MAGEEHPNSEVESSQPVGTVDESAVSRPVIGYLSPVLCSDWLIDSAQAVSSWETSTKQSQASYNVKIYLLRGWERILGRLSSSDGVTDIFLCDVMDDNSHFMLLIILLLTYQLSM